MWRNGGRIGPLDSRASAQGLSWSWLELGVGGAGGGERGSARDSASGGRGGGRGVAAAEPRRRGVGRKAAGEGVGRVARAGGN